LNLWGRASYSDGNRIGFKARGAENEDPFKVGGHGAVGEKVAAISIHMIVGE